MPNTKLLKSKIDALRLNTEGLLKLLGGTSEERERFWEILKGITTPAEFRLVNSHLDSIMANLKEAQARAKVADSAVRQIAG